MEHGAWSIVLHFQCYNAMKNEPADSSGHQQSAL